MSSSILWFSFFPDCVVYVVHCVCMHEYVYQYGDLKLTLRITLNLSLFPTVVIEAGCISQTQSSQVWLVSLTSFLWKSSVSVFLSLGCHSHLAFHMGLEDQNSILHTIGQELSFRRHLVSPSVFMILWVAAVPLENWVSHFWIARFIYIFYLILPQKCFI